MKHIKIYSSEVIMETEGEKTFLVITEVRTIDHRPLRSYHYEMPNQFKGGLPIYDEDQHFYQYHPN